MAEIINCAYKGGRAIPLPDITLNSTYRRHFGLAQNFAYSFRTGRYSAARGKFGQNHRNQPIAMTGNSRKRKRLTLQEKLEAFKMLESGNLPSAVMYKFGISFRSDRSLKSQRAALFKEAEKTAHYLQSKSQRGGQYPEIEEKIVAS